MVVLDSRHQELANFGGERRLILGSRRQRVFVQHLAEILPIGVLPLGVLPLAVLLALLRGQVSNDAPDPAFGTGPFTELRVFASLIE